jgi:hypothetical protein
MSKVVSNKKENEKPDHLICLTLLAWTSFTKKYQRITIKGRIRKKIHAPAVAPRDTEKNKHERSMIQISALAQRSLEKLKKSQFSLISSCRNRPAKRQFLH